MKFSKFFLTLVLALPSSVYAAAGARLQIGYVSFVPGVAPLWVASDRKLFAQEGVDPELVFIGTAPTMLASMMAREVSLALTAGTAVMSAIAAGAPLKIFATFTNWLTVDLIARPGIARPQDLKGKRIGVQSIGGGIWMQALLALERVGLDPVRDQLRLQVIGPQAQLAKALEAGVIDATVLPPAFSRPLKRRGFPVLLEVRNTNIPLTVNSLVGASETSEPAPQAVEPVLKGLYAAWHSFTTLRIGRRSSRSSSGGCALHDRRPKKLIRKPWRLWIENLIPLRKACSTSSACLSVRLHARLRFELMK